jgi:hypothetical protein
MATTYYVGTNNQVKSRDLVSATVQIHTPFGDNDSIWRDVMTHPTNEDIVIIVGTSFYTDPDPQVPTENVSIQVSTDGGTTWIVSQGDWKDNCSYFYEVWFCEDGQTIWAVAKDGCVVKSTDMGVTFTTQTFIAGQAYSQTAAIYALDDTNAIVLGSPGEDVTQSECFVWLTTDGGSSWTTLNGGSTLVFPDILQPGPNIGNANGIWMSNDMQTIVAATGYTNQISTDGGATFTGETDAESLPPINKYYMYRSGIHLTWYPTYNTSSPDVFRHTGGAIFQITESVDGGQNYLRTRHYSNGLPDFPLPPGNTPGEIPAAHFYTLYEGFYAQNEYLYSSQDGGASGVTIDNFQQGSQILSIWTGESPIANNPVYYVFQDCCDDNLCTWNNNILVLEYTGICDVGFCPDYIQQLIVTYFQGIEYNGFVYSCHGCLVLTEISELPTDPYTIIPYEAAIGDTTGDYVLDWVIGCDKCCTVFPCYKLTDCEGIQDPIYTGSDLNANLGEVITIEEVDGEPVSGCWLVELSDINCVDVPTVVIDKCYATCEDCLPVPQPPLAPTGRNVLPNYTTGNCDPKIVEKAFCDFADLMYKDMMSRRYQIAQCCPKDENKIWIQKEKIKAKLLESENPTPDQCNPECYAYEATIFDGFSAVTTYTDCYGVEQVINTTVSVNVQYLNFCALNTNPPTTVISDAENNEVGTYVLNPVEDCVVPIPLLRYYGVLIIPEPNGGSPIIVDYKDSDGNPQQLIINPCPGKQCDAVEQFICAEYGTISVSDNTSPVVYADNENCPSGEICTKDSRITFYGDCP